MLKSVYQARQLSFVYGWCIQPYQLDSEHHMEKQVTRDKGGQAVLTLKLDQVAQHFYLSFFFFFLSSQICFSNIDLNIDFNA